MSETTETTETVNGHSAHVKPRYDDVDIPVIVLLGTFSAIMTFVIICFLQGLYYSWSESIKEQDWNSVALTPEEKIIVKQKKLRNGFFETESGDVYISVDTAAKKLLAARGDLSLIKVMPTEDAVAPVEKKPAVDPVKPAEPKASEPKAEPEKAKQEKAEPPGPDATTDSKSDPKSDAEPAKTEPAKKSETEKKE